MDSKRNMAINALVWAWDLSKAQEIAEKFTKGTSSDQMLFINSSADYTLRTFVRSPNCISTQSPGGIADIIILFLSSNDPVELESAKKYVDTRNTIPIKVLCCESPYLDEAALLECKYVHVSEVTGAESETIIKEAKKFEETLLNCFNKFDINGNGLISIDELIKVSAELNHHLEQDDAQMIANSLDETKSNSGNISFEGFKKWWLMGKRDFQAFRRIIKAEMSVNKLIKLTTKKFNSYLENLKSNVEQISQEEELQGMDLNLHSKQSFDNGLGFFLELCTGSEAKEAIASYPSTIKTSPVGFSVRVSFSDAESANGVCEVLNQIASTLLAEIPILKPYLDMGLQYAFRTSGNCLVLDLSMSGMISDIIVAQSQMLGDLQKIDISSNLTFHLFSALTLDFFLNEVSIIKNIEKFMHLKLHLNTKSFGLRKLWSQVSEQIKANNVSSSGIRKIAFGIEALLAMRSFKIDLGFDATEFSNMFLEMASYEHYTEFNDSLQEAKEAVLAGKTCEQKDLNKFKSKLLEFKEQAKSMKEMIPEEFTSILKSVNFEKFEIECFGNMPNTYFLLKTTINIPGLNAVRDDIMN